MVPLLVMSDEGNLAGSPTMGDLREGPFALTDRVERVKSDERRA
jgi:hypothetical protein